MGKGVVLVLSRDKGGMLWLKKLVGCEQSECGIPCESCWATRIPGCGRKWASGGSWAWQRWAASGRSPAGSEGSHCLLLRSNPVFWEIYLESCSSWLQEDFALRQRGLGKEATPSKKPFARLEVSLKWNHILNLCWQVIRVDPAWGCQ